MNPKRVLMLVEGGELPDSPGAAGYSGFARYFCGGVSRLKHQGYEIIFGTLRERTPLHPLMEELSCPTFALNAHSVATYPLAIRRLIKVIRQYSPGILHFHESIQASVGGLAARIAGEGIPIFHRHHTTLEGPTYFFSRAAGRLCHVTMTVSQAVAECAYEEGVSPDKVFVALNGVPDPQPLDSGRIESLRKNLNIVQGEKVVVVVGRLRPEKGHLVLVEAFRRISAQLDTPVHLVIVGSGGEEEKIIRAAQGLRGVHLVGHQPDVATWFGLADVAVVPSLKEPFGLVAAEAMACSRPLIASAVDGLTEIVENRRTGLLVAPGRPDELARAVMEVLTSPSLAASLSAKARLCFERTFTLERMADQWAEIYENAVSRFGHRIP